MAVVRCCARLDDNTLVLMVDNWDDAMAIQSLRHESRATTVQMLDALRSRTSEDSLAYRAACGGYYHQQPKTNGADWQRGLKTLLRHDVTVADTGNGLKFTTNLQGSNVTVRVVHWYANGNIAAAAAAVPMTLAPSRAVIGGQPPPATPLSSFPAKKPVPLPPVEFTSATPDDLTRVLHQLQVTNTDITDEANAIRTNPRPEVHVMLYFRYHPDPNTPVAIAPGVSY
jgi:hypothetical protein